VSGLKDWKVDKKQTCTKTEACKLYSGVFRVLLPNVIKIDRYNFELYRFKVDAFFERVYTRASRAPAPPNGFSIVRRSMEPLIWLVFPPNNIKLRFTNSSSSISRLHSIQLCTTNSPLKQQLQTFQSSPIRKFSWRHNTNTRQDKSTLPFRRLAFWRCTTKRTPFFSLWVWDCGLITRPVSDRPRSWSWSWS